MHIVREYKFIYKYYNINIKLFKNKHSNTKPFL